MQQIVQGSPISIVLQKLALDQSLSRKAYLQYKEFASKCLQHYGKTQTIKILKDINSRSRHYVAGYPKGDMFFAGIKLKMSKKSCLPKRLNLLQEFLTVEPNTALLIPNIVYEMRDKPNYDISSITEPSSARDRLLFEDRFKRWLSKNSPCLTPAKTDMLFTCKGGPNGPSAVSHAQDAVAILLTTWPGGSFEEMIKTIHPSDSWLEQVWINFSKDVVTTDLPIKFRNNDPPLNAKLEFLSAPAGKTRIVDVVNWWIQALLLPLHESLMNHFRIIGNDATWNQETAVDQIRDWTNNGRQLSSFDLSSATDRWPAEKHQYLVVKGAFGEKIAKTWLFCMIRIPPYFHKEKKHIFYAAGQPMGTYSSWAVLNLSHHQTIRWISDELGKPYEYVVLGDDVVIADPKVAKAYRIYMRSLGVSISKTKSIICENGKPSSAEFARHILRDGRNVGTLSPNLLRSIHVDHEWPMCLELLRELKSKFGYVILVSEVATLVPKRVDNLLRVLINKHYEKDLLVYISSGLEGLTLPVTFCDVIPEDINKDEYTEYLNPWLDIDKSHANAVFSQKWREQANIRLNQLNKLDNAFVAGNLRNSCHLLELESHPIYRIKEIMAEELTNAMWKVMSMGSTKVFPTIIDTSIDLLIAVLVEGKSYKQWRDSKTVKFRITSKLMRKTYLESISMPKRVVSQKSVNEQHSWENYANMWEASVQA